MQTPCLARSGKSHFSLTLYSILVENTLQVHLTQTATCFAAEPHRRQAPALLTLGTEKRCCLDVLVASHAQPQLSQHVKDTRVIHNALDKSIIIPLLPLERSVILADRRNVRVDTLHHSLSLLNRRNQRRQQSE